MTAPKIERGKPVPRPGASARTFPFEKMSPGESFFLAAKGTQTAKDRQSSVLSAARRRGYRVTTRILTEGGKRGVRVWLVDDLNPKTEDLTE